MLFFASAEEKKVKKLVAFIRANQKRFYRPLIAELFREVADAVERGKITQAEGNDLRRQAIYSLNTLFSALMIMGTQTLVGADQKHMKKVSEAALDGMETMIEGGRNNAGIQLLLARRTADINAIMVTSGGRELVDAQMSQALFLVDRAYGRHLMESGVGDYSTMTTLYVQTATPMLIEFTRAAQTA